jgi:hypothetical protein
MYELFDSNKNDDIPSFLLALSSQFVNRQEVGVNNISYQANKSSLMLLVLILKPCEST